MNPLDTLTLFVTGGLVTIVCAVYFLLETLIRRNDVVGRYWSVFYIGAIFVVFSYVVSMIDPATWWALAPANGTYVAALGMLWSGARVANGRRSLVLLPVLAGAAVAVATVVPGPEGGYWAGSFETFVGVAGFAGLAALETGRGNLGRMLSARILAIMLAAVAVFFAGRAGFFLLAGPDDPVFELYFGTGAATLFEVCLAVIGTITLSSVQADRFGRRGPGRRESGDDSNIDGVLGLHTFRELAESWLLRSLRERTTLVMLVIEIADLDEINLAFGRAAGDSAIRVTARLAATNAPTAALVGRLSPRRFALLMKLPTNDSVEGIADRIADAVLNTSIDDQDRFRVTTFRGIATTRTAGSRFEDLIRAAGEAVAMDAAAGRAKAAAAAAVPS